MTIELMDSFDAYSGTSATLGIAEKWTSFTISNSGGTQSLQAGRFGGQCLRRAYTSGGAAAGAYSRSLPSAGASKAVGLSYRSSLVTAHATGVLAMILGFREGATYHASVTVNTDGSVSAYRNSSATAGTLLGSSAAGVISSNVWHHIQAEIVIHDSTGRVRVLVDGTEVLNLTGVDTRNAGTAGTIDTILLGGTYNGTPVSHDYDDLYVNDTATALGEKRIEAIPATSDATVVFAPNTGSTNYTQIDEAPVNGDTDYVQGTNVGDTDTYNLANLSSSPASISAVQIVAYAKKTDIATRTLALQVKSGASTSDGPAYTLAGGYTRFERLLLTDPDTAAAWTTSAVNALQGGPKVAA